SRTPIQVLPVQTAHVSVGGQGRPVIGRFVPQPGYSEPVYFGGGSRALYTVRPEGPTPDNYKQMTKRQQQAWLRQWRETDEARAYYDAMWHDPQRRHYSFRIQDDGTFRIEDVIPGKYTLNVWLEEPLGDQGPPEEIGGYSGTIEVPEMAEAYSDEPLDLGDLVVKMRTPLHVGDVAPLFEAKTLDGQDIRLADYRGRFVLLSFWSPTFHPELERLQQLHAIYGALGNLQIIGLGGTDTLDEVNSYVEEHSIEWPQVYFGPDWDAALLRQLGGQMQIMLIDPEGKIVATWLRGEELTNTVRQALAETD
ncbi:MAG: redoxin domain-containing protein, partial [Phycisphaerales bacterium]